MKTDKSQKRKYAFNINDIKITKKFQGSLKDFQKLNRGLYDEIENNDLSIKENKALLRKLKNTTVKEFVYTNKEIPDHWKTKLDYENSLLKMFVKDKEFLYYLGHGGSGDNPNLLKEVEKNGSPRLNILNNKSPKEKAFPKINSNATLNSPVKSLSNNHIVRNTKLKENNNFSDKEILGILDEFKNAYPLFEKENLNTRDNNLIQTDRKSKTFYDNKFLKKNFTQNNNHLTNKKKTSFDNNNLNNNLNYFPSLKQKHNRRQNTFRQNIFTNLLPSNNQNINLNKNMTGYNSCTNFRKKKKDYKNKNDNNIFLNSNNDFYVKKININNPAVMKYLEGINFFGPYFSYCPPCENRNLEFYKNLEPNQCIQIIQQIKKNKGKNIIVNKKKPNNSVKKHEQNNKDDQDINDKSIKYNSGSVKNNYYESDSMIQQVSEGFDDREKDDIFD